MKANESSACKGYGSQQRPISADSLIDDPMADRCPFVGREVREAAARAALRRAKAAG